MKIKSKTTPTSLILDTFRRLQCSSLAASPDIHSFSFVFDLRRVRAQDVKVHLHYFEAKESRLTKYEHSVI